MRPLWTLLIVVLSAHLLLLSEPLLLRALVIAGFAPGFLLTALLAGDEHFHNPGERLLFAVGAFFTVTTLGMLLLSYLPGGVLRWQALLFFNALTAVLCLLVWRSKHSQQSEDRRVSAPALYPTSDRRWLVAGVVVLLVVSRYYRLTLYYVPYLLHPTFADTLRYLMSERIVGSARPPSTTWMISLCAALSTTRHIRWRFCSDCS